MTSTNPHTNVTTKSIRYEITGSKGDPYTVSVDPVDGVTRCTCRAGSFNKDCKHQRDVREGTAGRPIIRITPKPARPLSALFHTSAAELEV